MVTGRVSADKGMAVSGIRARNLEGDSRSRHEGEVAVAGGGNVPGGGNRTEVAQGANGRGACRVQGREARVIAVDEGDGVRAHELLVNAEALVKVGRCEDNVIRAVGSDSNVGVFRVGLQESEVGG